MTGRGREEITTFARAMEHELGCNAHKGDPLELTAREHVRELLYHAAKLYMALRFAHREAALEYRRLRQPRLDGGPGRRRAPVRAPPTNAEPAWAATRRDPKTKTEYARASGFDGSLTVRRTDCDSASASNSRRLVRALRLRARGVQLVDEFAAALELGSSTSGSPR